MHPKKFLLVGGIILVALGILGLVRVVGPAPAESVFGNYWWFDAGESWTYLLVGGVSLLGEFLFPAGTQKALVVVLGALSILLGLYSIFVGHSFLAANLETPADTLFNLLLGAWALFAGFRGEIAEIPA